MNLTDALVIRLLGTTDIGLYQESEKILQERIEDLEVLHKKAKKNSTGFKSSS